MFTHAKNPSRRIVCHAILYVKWGPIDHINWMPLLLIIGQ